MKHDEPDPEPPSCDELLEAAVAEWRSKHRLREDDAVLLLVELLRIHQQHWEELRRREMPCFEPLQVDMQRLVEANRTCQQQAATLVDLLRALPPPAQESTVMRTTAWLAALAGSLAGCLLGRAWR